MKRYISLLAAIVLQLCLGGVYAWSAFVPSLQSAYGLSSSQTQVVFGSTLLLFVVFMIPAGRALHRKGPRILLLLSGALLCAGYECAGFFGARFLFLLTSYSLLIAPAISCGYVAAISTGMRWFPTHKGLVGELTLAGFGAGAIVLMGLAETCFARGWDALRVFRFLGWLYGTIALVCALFIFSPGISHDDQSDKISTKVFLRQRKFWGLSAGLLFGTFPGLVTIGNLKPIGMAMGLGALAAASGITALSIGNAIGRILCGRFTDWYNPKVVAVISLFMAATSVAVLPLIGKTSAGFLAAAFFLGFCYGGSLAIYSAQTAHVFGTTNFGKVYPLALIGHGLAAVVGASLGGLLRDLTGSFTPSYVIASAGAIIGLCLYAWLMRNRPQ